MKKLSLIVNLVWLVSAAIILTGDEILLTDLIIIKLGTLLAWIAVTFLSFSCYLYVSNNRRMKPVQFIALIMALLWFPVSFILSGNSDLNFYNIISRRVWLFYTVFIVVVSVCSSLYVIIQSSIIHLRR